MSKITVIGAGKTGRGFIGRLLAEAGEKIAFIDKNEELVSELNKKQSFDIYFFGNSRERLTVKEYEAYTWENAAFDDTELIFVSVCGQNLPSVGAELKKRLDPSKKYYVITCENSSNPAKTLGDAIGMDNVCVSESTVFCTTIEASGLDISSENYPFLQCNAGLLCGYVPSVPSVKALNNFSDFLTRKLYTYNAASCVIAYVGALLGYEVYGDAANDEMILALLDKNYKATNAAMCKRFGYEYEDQKQFALLSKNKFTDTTIADTVSRNAREPHRKLGSNERIIGAAKLLLECGEDPSVLILTAAAALLYEDRNDPVWSEMISSKGICGVLRDVCGLNENDTLYQKIVATTESIKRDVRVTIYGVLNS